jgi:2-aminoadipate transaminase
MAVDWSTRFAQRTHGDDGSALAEILSMSSPPGDVLTFSGGFPAPETWAIDVLAPIAARLVREDPAVALQYAAAEGIASVRAYLRDRVAELDGRRPAPDELMVTSGGIDCTELLAKSLIDPGDVAIVEAPTYLGAIMGFRSYQGDVRGVPLDDEGIAVDVLETWLRGGLRPKVVYVIPDHQNPTGRTLPHERRLALVGLARRYGFCILEDVAYRELSFDGTWPASLWSLGPDVVVQSGTFSKTLFPGVRLGWAAGPAPLVARLAVAKLNADQCAAALGQRLLEEYGRAGHFGPQLARARAFYERRWHLLDAALAAHLPEGCRWTRPSGGFFTWVELPFDVDTATLGPAALAAGVAFVAGRPFYADGRASNALRLSYSRTPDDRIDEGIRRLAGVLAAADPR